jgi:hypothetical protein
MRVLLIAKAPGVETASQGLKISIVAFFIPSCSVTTHLTLYRHFFVGIFFRSVQLFCSQTCLSSASIGYLWPDETLAEAGDVSMSSVGGISQLLPTLQECDNSWSFRLSEILYSQAPQNRSLTIK